MKKKNKNSQPQTKLTGSYRKRVKFGTYEAFYENSARLTIVEKAIS